MSDDEQMLTELKNVLSEISPESVQYFLKCKKSIKNLYFKYGEVMWIAASMVRLEQKIAKSVKDSDEATSKGQVSLYESRYNKH